MKKFLLPLVMGALLFIGLTSMTQMAAPNFDCQGYCAAFGGFYNTPGDCMSTCRVCTNNGTNGPVCLCKFFDNLGFDNQGQCVSTLRGF